MALALLRLQCFVSKANTVAPEGYLGTRRAIVAEATGASPLDNGITRPSISSQSSADVIATKSMLQLD